MLLLPALVILARVRDLVDKNAAAECLYMIVMGIPEAAEQFQNTEIGDVDGDGLKEFIDGWGHPIRFIRWPVGFVDFSSIETTDGPAGSPGDSSATPVIPAGLQLEWGLPIRFAIRQPSGTAGPIRFNASNEWLRRFPR